MPTVSKILLATLASIVLGVGSAFVVTSTGLSAGNVSIGPWRANTTTGSADANLYTRARVAIAGLLALSPRETLYFNADVDGAGEKLDAGCDYVLTGNDPGARWWSLTAYGADHFLIANDANRYSFSQTTIAREADRSWSVNVSTAPKSRNWLPSGKPDASGRFALTLRLYNPSAEVAAQPANATLPRIVKTRCR